MFAIKKYRILAKNPDVSVMFSKCIAAEAEVKAGYVESKIALEMLLSYLLR